MYYLGGKYRQSREIVRAAQELHPSFEWYVEPFCGAMWAACAIISAFPGRDYYLSDAHPALMDMWWAAIYGEWDPPERVTEADYNWYREHRPAGDPMTAYLGFALSFGGKYFAGFARNRSGHDYAGRAKRATDRKIAILRTAYPVLERRDYQTVVPPEGALVYLDPPYIGRTQRSTVDLSVCDATYEEYARKVGKRCVTIATDFRLREGWAVLHDYGDTVVRHHRSRGDDGTREYLMLV